MGVNLAQLRQLPGIAPTQELTAYREMVQEISRATRIPPIGVTSKCAMSDRDGRVYGYIACRGPSPTDEHIGTPVEVATQALNARISGNQALSHWLRQMALGLQRIEPRSSAVISERNLFGCNAGSYAKHQRRQVVAGTKALPACRRS